MNKKFNIKEWQTKHLLKENVLGDLPSDKLMKMKWNPVTEEEVPFPDSGAQSLSQVDPSYKSNIALKWKSTEDMESDLDKYIMHAKDSGGYDLLDDLVSSLEQRVIAYKEIRKKALR